MGGVETRWTEESPGAKNEEIKRGEGIGRTGEGALPVTTLNGWAKAVKEEGCGEEMGRKMDRLDS